MSLFDNIWSPEFVTNSFIVLVVSFLILVFLKQLSGKKLNLPPGPKGLPIVGYVPFMGKRPYKRFMELKKEYGNVIGLYLGSRYTVILEDLAAVKEAYSKNELSARPPGLFLFNEKYDNVANMGGKLWVEHSRFNKTILRNVGMGKDTIEEAIQEQLSLAIHKIDAKIAYDNDVNVREALCLSSDNVIFSMICGKTIPDGDPKSKVLHDYQRQALRNVASDSTSFAFPFLKPILKFLPNFKTPNEAITKMENLLNSEIESHKEHMELEEPSDFMDHFLLQIQKANGENGFTTNVLNGHSQMFLLGGSETSRTNVEWGLMLLAKHQDIQEKAYNEIISNVGPEKQISLKDRDSLPYNYAVMLETLRRKTTPLSAARRAQKATKIFDYDIPVDTVVMANLWNIHMNPEVWPEPKKFNPERFLSPDGKIINHDNYIPFSYGQRKCPGEKLALMQVFITLTTLIQKFKFLPSTNGLDFSKEISLTIVPTNPTLKIERR